MNTTEAIRAKDDKHFLHPWENLQTYGHRDRTIASRAEGIYVYDSEGNRLIDGPAGMWCVQIGYGRKEIAEAIAKQAMQMSYNSPWGLTNEPAALLASKIAELAPGDLNHVFFTTGGSTAVDSALRFVAFYNNYLGRPDKKKIIAREALDITAALTFPLPAQVRSEIRTTSTFADDLVHHIPAPNPYRRPEGMSIETFCTQKIQDLENKILELGADNIAAFIAEPILASGGVIVPPPGYHKRCFEICRKYDIITISDEVVTGFGRLGHWFASKAVFDIQPDIITCAKGLTSGYLPLGALIISDHLLSQVSGENAKGAIYANGYTYSGHPVSCAAALKNIEIIASEGILEHVREISPYFMARLQELKDIPIVGDIRGQGLMACVECVIDQDAKDPLVLDKEIGTRIDQHCQALGLIVRPLINMNVLSPPLIITQEQIDDMIALLRRGIEMAMRDVQREGLWKD